MRSFARSTFLLVLSVLTMGSTLLATSPAVAQWGWTNSGSSVGKKVVEEREVSVPHVVGTSVHVETRNASVRVVRSDRKDVRILATVTAGSKARLDEITVLIERASKEAGSGLRVVAQYGEDNKHQRHDSLALVVEIPDARGVTAVTSNGPIDIIGLDGEATLRTSNGSITVNQHNGVVRASTSNSPIIVSGAVGLVDVTTSNGSVKVSEATGDVKVTTSNASITVTQSPGNSGMLQLRSSNGSVKVVLAESIRGQLAISTSNARITVADLPHVANGARVERLSGTRAVVHFDDADVNHVISTSNASVTISHIGE